MNLIEVKKFVTSLTPKISVLFPKKKKLWVFGCWFGRLYSDNSKYLFEYINKLYPDIDCVWLTRLEEVQKVVRSKGFKCYKRFSLKGLICALRAEVAFTTSDEITDLSPFISRKYTKVIQLFHGIAGKGFNIFLSEKDSINTKKRFQQYFWMATSQKYIEEFSKHYSITQDRFTITGYPRNDTFVYKPTNTYVEQLMEKYQNFKFVI